LTTVAVLPAGIFDPADAGTIVGQVSTKKARYRQYTVVYIESIPEMKFEPPQEPAVMDQKGLEFIPHVLPILEGTTVEFRNSDNVLHNVFTPDKIGDKFNLGSFPKNETRSHTFTKSCEKACDAVVLCNVHPEMEAYIVIVTNPYFAVTDEQGDFTITDVPPGTYTLRVWHERLKEASQSITIGAKDTLTVNFALGR
jgi:plastocyanin